MTHDFSENAVEMDERLEADIVSDFADAPVAVERVSSSVSRQTVNPWRRSAMTERESSAVSPSDGIEAVP